MCTRRRTLSSVMAAGYIWCPPHTRRYSGSIANADRDAALFGINELELVSLNFTSWNQLDGWPRQVDRLRQAA